MSEVSYALIDRPTLEQEGPEFVEDAKRMANCCLGIYHGFVDDLDEIMSSLGNPERKLLRKGSEAKYDAVKEHEDWTEIAKFRSDTGPESASVLIAQFGKLGDDYVVVCRGTQTTAEWQQNAKIGMTQYVINLGKDVTHGKVHKGFYQVYGQFRVALMSEIRQKKPDYKSKSKPHPRLLVTGHSLGGALATLATYEIGVRFGDSFKVRMYNFASPRVAGNTFRDNFKGTIAAGYRFVNSRDIVPDVPPVHGPYWWCYHHVGQPFEFTGDSKKKTVQQHDMFYYRDQLEEPDTWVMTKQ